MPGLSCLFLLLSTSISWCARVVDNEFSYTAMNQTRNEQLQKRIRSRFETLGQSRDPGAPLPKDICKGHVTDMFEVDSSSALGTGMYGAPNSAVRIGENSADYAIKTMEWKPCNTAEKCTYTHEGKMVPYFDPVELWLGHYKLPFVAELLDVFVEPDKKSGTSTVSIVMPRYQGGDLFDVFPKIQAMWWTVEQWRLLMAQMAYGLWSIHKLGVIYGDLKSENTLLVDSTLSSEDVPRVVLADFGIITLGCNATACTERQSGTRAMMAPAIFDGKKYGIEVDWWSFAVQSAEFFGARLFQQREKGFNQEPEWSQTTPSEVVDFLSNLVTKRAFEKWLATDMARAAMMAHHPADHPILSHPFWLGDAKHDRSKIAAFWLDICKRYATNPERCPLSYDKPLVGPGNDKPLPLCEATYTESRTAIWNTWTQKRTLEGKLSSDITNDFEKLGKVAVWRNGINSDLVSNLTVFPKCFDLLQKGLPLAGKCGKGCICWSGCHKECTYEGKEFVKMAAGFRMEEWAEATVKDTCNWGKKRSLCVATK